MSAAVLVGMFAVIGLGWFSRSELALRRRAKHTRPMPVPPRSLVRVLANEELEAAIERAVGFEEQTAQAMAVRIEHYRAAGRLAAVATLPPDPITERDSA